MDYKGITLDSRKVEPGYMFAAIKGEKSDGHNYISKALDKGAKGIILEDKRFLSSIPEGIEKILTDDTRKTFAEKANQIYGNPSSELTLIGVTGTKGKTTTSYFLKHILESAGYKTGMIGTVANYIGDKMVPTSMTTPESDEINNLFSQMVKEGCTHCVMEVSAHGVTQKRIHGLDFDMGIYTNLSSDHLDFYKNWNNYADAKRQFFKSLKPEAKVIYNSDDSHNKSMLNGKNVKFSYGSNLFEPSDFQFQMRNSNLESAIYEFDGFLGKINFPGKFNVSNAAAALSAASILGVDTPLSLGYLETMSGIPGRFQRINYEGKTIVIDFAHNTDSLLSVLETLKESSNGRPIYTVFGCAGESDKGKRPEMARVASALSDKVIVTSDECKCEDLEDIYNDMKPGFDGSQHFISDRMGAISEAVHNSLDNAIILLAGMGPQQNKLSGNLLLTDEEIVRFVIQ